MLDGLDKYILAIFCVFWCEFVAADQDVQRRGLTQSVKTVVGGEMIRENPSVAIRNAAVKIILDISRREGFTQLDRALLIRAQKGADLLPDLFPPAPAPDQGAEQAEPLDPEAKAWGELLDRTPAVAKAN
jgi:phage terminase small subunit